MTVAQIFQQKRMMIPSPVKLKSEMLEFLKGYKTKGAKKVAIGKEIKEQIYFICHLQESLKRHKDCAWYDGIQYSQRDLDRACVNLTVLYDVKVSIDFSEN